MITGPKGCAQRCLLLILARRVSVNLRCRVGQHILKADSRLSNDALNAALKALQGEGNRP